MFSSVSIFLQWLFWINIAVTDSASSTISRLTNSSVRDMSILICSVWWMFRAKRHFSLFLSSNLKSIFLLIQLLKNKMPRKSYKWRMCIYYYCWWRKAREKNRNRNIFFHIISRIEVKKNKFCFIRLILLNTINLLKSL